MNAQIKNLELHGGLSKIDRHGWIVKDNQGVLLELDKNELLVDSSYQRDAITNKITSIASSWSWKACGVITVANRGNKFYVIDGQHRVLAARYRSDISLLPCIIFETITSKEEAQGFIDANTLRKSMNAIDKYRAGLIAEDESCLFVKSIFDKYSLEITKCGKKQRSIKAIHWALRESMVDKSAFESTIKIADMVCNGDPIKEKLLSGLIYIIKYGKFDCFEKRFLNRIIGIGQDSLIFAAQRAASFYVRGGGKVYAVGIMQEINKGLRKKWEFDVN